MKLTVIIMTLLLPSVGLSISQEPQSQVEPGASVAGRITLRGTPVQGALVLVMSVPPAGRDPIATAKTDANGHYRITNLPPGRYAVIADAPALALQEETTRGFGREISLDRGETRDNLDFAMVRGGAITGRVLDANGLPIVSEQIIVIALSARGPRPYHRNHEMMITDDRGVYRVYGLPPGLYRISVGEGSGSAYRKLNYGKSYYPHTYYPGVLEESKAGVIEVTEGGEVSGVDITVGSRERTYEASGRIVDAETDRPQPDINWGYGGNAMSNFGMKSDENGGFKITGLMPGRYSVFAGCEGDYYSEKVEFDVRDRNVTGLEIRRKRGASISGRVVVESVTDPAILSKLSQVSLSAVGEVNQVGSSIDPDGSFYFCGLRPGRVRISAWSQRHPGFWLLRVERKGVQLQEEIEVSSGDHVTDIRVVLTYATGVIRGQVTVAGPELPQGMTLHISARRLGDERIFKHFSAQTDDRGRFAIEGLAPGEYELSVGGIAVSSAVKQVPALSPVKQRVIVTNGEESAINLVVKIIER